MAPEVECGAGGEQSTLSGDGREDCEAERPDDNVRQTFTDLRRHDELLHERRECHKKMMSAEQKVNEALKGWATTK